MWWSEDVWIEVAAPLSEAPIVAQSARISLAVSQFAPGATAASTTSGHRHAG